jgi:hypothetical protein
MKIVASFFIIVIVAVSLSDVDAGAGSIASQIGELSGKLIKFILKILKIFF